MITVDLMRGGIVLVEAFGHVETSHFRATFRLELGSQQRGAEHGQGAEKRGQAEPYHGAGRTDALPPSGCDGKWLARAEGRGVGGSQVEQEGKGVEIGVGGGERQEEETQGEEKWSWASRVRQRSPVPGARPGEEKKEGVEAVRSPRERRR